MINVIVAAAFLGVLVAKIKFYQKQCEKTPTSTGSEMDHTPIVS